MFLTYRVNTARTISEMRPVDRMFEAMEEAHLKDADMVRLLDISKQRFSSWKKRGSLPKIMLDPIARILGITLLWLMTGQEPKRPIPLSEAKVSIAPGPYGIDRLRASIRAQQLILNLSKAANDGDLTDAEIDIINESLGLAKPAVQKSHEMGGINRVRLEPVPENLSQLEIDMVRFMRDMGADRRDCLHAIARDSAHAARDEAEALKKTKRA